MAKRWGNLIEQIIERSNMDAAFDEVVGDLKPIKTFRGGQLVKIDRRQRYEKRREAIINRLTEEIRTGEFRVKSYHEITVKDGPKVRTVQSPSVEDRIGVNAVMRVVEKYTYPTVVRTSAAAIKGRGMHHLYCKMRSDIRSDREGTQYFYKCDIKKFYQNIGHSVMKQCIRRYIKGSVLLRILDGFIDLLEQGISIGLRSSQCFGNLLLSALDHRMKETEHVRYYYRYCDDILVLAPDKATCWKYRNIIHEEVERLGLTIKPDECVRPTTEGIDFLGFVDYGDHGRLRKRTKQKAARKLAKVRSRRRRREIIGSFKGMAKWCDSHNLYYKLTNKRMEDNGNEVDFKSLGINYVAKDGKKRFAGKGVTLRSITNLKIKILDYEEDVTTKNGLRWLVRFRYENGNEEKYFTDDEEQKYDLTEMKRRGVLGRVWTTITPEVYGDGKVRYRFT